MSLAFTAAQWTNENNNQTRKRQPCMRKTIKNRPYNDPTKMEPDEYTNQSEEFQNLQDLKNSTPTTLDDIQQKNADHSERVNELLNKITAFNAENDGHKLANYEPLTKPNITNNRETIKDSNDYQYERGQYLNPDELLPQTLEKDRIGPYIANENQDVPYSNYKQSYVGEFMHKYPSKEGFQNIPVVTTSHATDHNLMEKINYMIHLLEEQAVEKTANITEEFILYIFLGVFVIYTIDSFTKMGKYKR